MTFESSYSPSAETGLRLSKSSFGTYTKCPRSYWWSYIEGMNPPPNDAMIRGSLIHQVLEDSLLSTHTVREVGVISNVTDPAVEALDELMQEIDKKYPDWELVEAEYKHEIPTEIGGRQVMLVGKIDGVFRDKDGKLIICELKTGELGSSKVSRTRKELNFYRYMLDIAGYDVEDCYYMVIAPDATNSDVALKLDSSKRKTVLWGTMSGIAYVEKMNKRSYNTTVDKVALAVEGIYNEQWPKNWSEYYCPEWCAFHLACESEVNEG